MQRALLLSALCATVCLADEPPTRCDITQWAPAISESAARFSIPASWIRAVILSESAGCENLDGQPTTSGAGAMGLMQLMPNTWREYRERLGLGDNAYNPRDNILAGAAYLRDLYDRYGWPGAAAAYHAGPQRYEASLSHAKPLPEATQEYLARIDRAMTSTPSKRVHSSAPSPSKADALFAELRNRKVERKSQTSGSSSDVQDRSR